MVATRAKEKSVEGYFQKYGKFSPKDGLRHLNRDQFRKALIDLNLTWCNPSSTERDVEEVKNYFKEIAESCMLTEEDMQYGLTLV